MLQAFGGDTTALKAHSGVAKAKVDGKKAKLLEAKV